MVVFWMLGDSSGTLGKTLKLPITWHSCGPWTTRDIPQQVALGHAASDSSSARQSPRSRYVERGINATAKPLST